MRVHGEDVTFTGPADAQRAGVAAIYQEPAIVPDLNVAENIFMSHQDRGALVRWRRMYQDAEAALSAHEVGELFKQIRRLTESGVAVLCLYGVSMVGDGVSKVSSRRLPRAVEEVA